MAVGRIAPSDTEIRHASGCNASVTFLRQGKTVTVVVCDLSAGRRGEGGLERDSYGWEVLSKKSPSFGIKSRKRLYLLGTDLGLDGNIPQAVYDTVEGAKRAVKRLGDLIESL